MLLNQRSLIFEECNDMKNFIKRRDTRKYETKMTFKRKKELVRI
jgi:hypothetical protein